MRAVRFEEYGDVDVLKVEEVPTPTPAPGEVVVRVVTAGTNPGEAGIRSGAGKERFPAHFPEGQGSDLAGVISAVGDGVQGLAVGQDVIGLSDGRNAQAEYALLAADRVVPKPDSLDWAAAATLYVAGTTALVMLDVTRPQPGETVAISGAAGGVGVFATQLAVATGARVLAIAGPHNHEQLRAWGAEPVAYGDGLEDRLRELAPEGIAAFLDTHGGGYVELALRLGVPKERIETIIDFPTAGRLGTVAKGMAAMADPAAGVARLAQLVADGAIEVPVKGRFPLDQVQDAYRAVESRSGLGKVVLDISTP
jgi:NADPH:quinone reductase-like Zn-dependent oxidoreductase